MPCPCRAHAVSLSCRSTKGRFTHSMPFPCRAPAIPLPCRAAKGLEFVFHIWFTQCGRVWFTLAMPRPCHALTMPFFSRPHYVNQMGKTHSKLLAARHGRRTTWARHGHGMLCANRPLVFLLPVVPFVVLSTIYRALSYLKIILPSLFWFLKCLYIRMDNEKDGHLTHWGRLTQICVFNTRLFSLHNILNYAMHRACLRMVLLTDVYRNLTSLSINL